MHGAMSGPGFSKSVTLDPRSWDKTSMGITFDLCHVPCKSDRYRRSTSERRATNHTSLWDQHPGLGPCGGVTLRWCMYMPCPASHYSCKWNGTRPAVRVTTLPVGLVQDQLSESFLFELEVSRACPKRYLGPAVNRQPGFRRGDA